MTRKGQSAKPAVESRMYVSRPLAFEDGANKLVADFSNGVGRAIKGTGRTRSLGSMGLTLMSAQDYSLVRNNLSARDRSRLSHDIDDFLEGLNEKLLQRPSHADFCVKGLSFFGRNARSLRPGAWTTFSFTSDIPNNPVVNDDIDNIKTYFSDNGYPEPSLKPEKAHISVGEAQLHKIATGKNHNPHLYIPAGVVIPSSVELLAPLAEPIEG